MKILAYSQIWISVPLSKEMIFILVNYVKFWYKSNILSGHG